MKIAVTGANGQLGSELRERTDLSPQNQFIFVDIAELDLTKSDETEKFLSLEKPGLIVNCAAYTAVDKAEQEPDAAFHLNGIVPGILASYCKVNGSRLIHLSTDYVFDGTNHRPYNEEDLPDPQGIYAASKLLGERNIMKYNPDGAIVRTSWLYSSFGNNFVKTIFRKALTTDQLRVVSDQIGSPTYAGDLAEMLMKMINRLEELKGMQIFHFSNEGVASWYDFAKEIIYAAGIDSCTIIPVGTKDYPTPARRPFYSVLDKEKIKMNYETVIPYWKDSLEKCIKLLIDNKFS